MRTATLKIVAPVNRPEEVEPLLAAGADELYVGYLPPAWCDEYGDWDSLTRRQGTVANLATLTDFQALAAAAGRVTSLTLNQRYTEEQYPQVLEIADAWQSAGGHALIVSDPALLLQLKKRQYRPARHLSLLASCMNSATAAFFAELGVSRIVLPRRLTVDEIEAVSRGAPSMEYEALALYDDCELIDGLCGFYHGTAFPPDQRHTFAYSRTASDQPARVSSFDLCYAGHGCEIPFRTDSEREVEHRPRDNLSQPACAACAVLPLSAARVGFLKIAGRGLPLAYRLRAVRFLRQALEISRLGETPTARVPWQAMRELYCQTFGSPCHGRPCYFQVAE
jgi:U32 family peptidase